MWDAQFVPKHKFAALESWLFKYYRLKYSTGTQEVLDRIEHKCSECSQLLMSSCVQFVFEKFGFHVIDDQAICYIFKAFISYSERWNFVLHSFTRRKHFILGTNTDLLSKPICYSDSYEYRSPDSSSKGEGGWEGQQGVSLQPDRIVIRT
jgi:hypothetical protein